MESKLSQIFSLILVAKSHTKTFSLDLGHNDSIAKELKEVRDRNTHFDLNSASTVPQVSRFQLDYILRQYDWQFLTAPTHEKGSNGVVLVAR